MLDETELASTGIDLNTLNDDTPAECYPTESITEESSFRESAEAVLIDLEWGSWVQGVESSQ